MPNVALLITCLVDTLRPNIGFATIKLLEDAGCNVHVPIQTCCGQPAFNSGDRDSAKSLALQIIEAFEGFDYIVVPSGSCASMVIKHYPELFENDDNMEERAKKFAQKTHELTRFLVDIMKIKSVSSNFKGTITYHDSCSGLRELGIKSQPRKLLNSIEGVKIVEGKECENCCGFGGAFAVKYSELSTKIVSNKCEDIISTEAENIIGGDIGCLLNIAGRLSRIGSDIKVRHVAEVLSGMIEEPAIGEEK